MGGVVCFQYMIVNTQTLWCRHCSVQHRTTQANKRHHNSQVLYLIYKLPAAMDDSEELTPICLHIAFSSHKVYEQRSKTWFMVSCKTPRLHIAGMEQRSIHGLQICHRTVHLPVCHLQIKCHDERKIWQCLGKKWHILIRLQKWCGIAKDRQLEFSLGYSILFKIKETETGEQIHKMEEESLQLKWRWHLGL